MVRGATNVADPLLLEHLLKARLAAPGYELSSIVREDLSRGTPLSQRALQNLEHGLGALLPEQSPAHQKARVIVDDPH
jgi:hypothetical protein